MHYVISSLIIIFLLFGGICLVITLYTNKNNFVHRGKLNSKKGIVFFDIDDTLSTIPKQKNQEIIKHCIENGYDIGIVTASKRPINYVCNNSQTNHMSQWAPDILCEELHKHNFVTYNSHVVTTGEEFSISNAPQYNFDKHIYGKLKGWQISETLRRMNNYNLPGYDVILVDDNIDVLNGASQIVPFLRKVHVNNNITSQTLSEQILNLSV